MATIRHSNCVESTFEKDFNFLCRSRGRWKVWSDFVHLSAYSISNAVDSVHREKRESEYLKIAEEYSKEEMGKFACLFSATIMALEKNPDQDFLGDLYMRLELGNERAGQFFTPYNVCCLMADMQMGNVLDKLNNKGYIAVEDCCVGGGAMLVAFANSCRREKVNYHERVLFVGQDIDHTVAMMAYIQLSLLGCPGYIVVGNSLTEPLTGNTLYAPMNRETFVTPFYCSATWNARRMWYGLDSLFVTNSAEERQVG